MFPVAERVHCEVSETCVSVTLDRSALDGLQSLSEAEGFLRVSACMHLYTF